MTPFNERNVSVMCREQAVLQSHVYVAVLDTSRYKGPLLRET